MVKQLKKMEKKRQLRGEETPLELKHLDAKSVKIVYIVFQTLIILTLIAAIISLVARRNMEMLNHIFLCATGLLLFNVPNMMKKRLHVYIPTGLQILALAFIFTHYILGEILGGYKTLLFDKLLHTISGFAFGCLGFSLINLFNTREAQSKVSPFFVALVSFSFSMMIAVVWEIFEFAMDSLIGINMQRWQTDAANGYYEQIGRVGLIDTMYDIIVCTVGALLTSIFGYISLKTKSNALNKFIIRRFKTYEQAYEEASYSQDSKLEGALIKTAKTQFGMQDQDGKEVDYLFGIPLKTDIAAQEQRYKAKRTRRHKANVTITDDACDATKTDADTDSVAVSPPKRNDNVPPPDQRKN